MTTLYWFIATIGGLGIGAIFAARLVFPEPIKDPSEEEFPEPRRFPSPSQTDAAGTGA